MYNIDTTRDIFNKAEIHNGAFRIRFPPRIGLIVGLSSEGSAYDTDRVGIIGPGELRGWITFGVLDAFLS